MIPSGRKSIVRLLVVIGGFWPAMAGGGQEPGASGPPPGAAALAPLPLGNIKPAGWLRDQLRIQANGLSGHLDEFWPDIKDSAWFGGRPRAGSASRTGSTASSRWPTRSTTRPSRPRSSGPSISSSSTSNPTVGSGRWATVSNTSRTTSGRCFPCSRPSCNIRKYPAIHGSTPLY